MLIGIERRFVFVANTKTASTSIESVLAPFAEIRREGSPRAKHIPLRDAVPLYPELFGPDGSRLGEYFSFGVMRDPVDWIGSWFRYRKGNRVESPLPADMDFTAFWEQGDWNIRHPDGAPFLQADRFCDAQGRPMVDVIVPHDRLGAVFGQVCDLLGVQSDLPRKNVSTLREATVPDALLPDLHAHYARDYALLAALDTLNAAGFERLRGRRAA